MVTQAQAVTAIRQRLDETTESNWTDITLRGWINEAVRDIARKTETVQASATIDVDADDQTYTLSSDVLRVHMATYSADGDDTIHTLEFIDFNAVDSRWWGQQGTSRGTPREFTFWGTPPALEVKLYPVPAENGTLTVYYYKLPAELTTSGTDGSDALEVSAGYEDLVYDYVVYLALRRDRDPRWREHKETYDANLSTMAEMTRRWTDQAGSVTREGNRLPDWLTSYGVGYGGYYG